MALTTWRLVAANQEASRRRPTLGWTLDRVHEWLFDLLRTKGTDIFRSKGILSIVGWDERYVFQGVHMLLNSEAQGAWEDGEERRNRLVFIGRNLDRESLEAGFSSCLV